MDEEDSVSAMDNYGNTPLHNAARQCNVDDLQLLLEHGASVNAVNKKGSTPLHNAAIHGHVNVLKLLLDYGASVDIANKNGLTPLQYAVVNGHVAVLQLLLERRARVNTVNKKGYTPLHDAAFNGHVDILKMLLDNGASVDVVNSKGCTPLQYAAFNGHVDILQILLEHGASVNAVNNNGYTPLHDAALNGHVDISQLLLSHVAKVDAENKYGNTPLHNAARKGNVDDLKLLLAHGASVNAANKEGNTPLHYAAFSGHTDILQLLVDHGASVDAVKKKGYTPLHAAASKDQVECIKLLLKSGANMKARNDDGETPYQTAIACGFEKSARSLKNADVEEEEEEEYKRAYSEALQRGQAKNNRIPIMLVGQDRGGKTSLMARLLGEPFNKDQPSTIGIDVNVIELTEQNAEDSWVKKEVNMFMTNEDEAKKAIYKKTVEFVDSGVRKKSEGSAPKLPKPAMPAVPVIPETPVKPVTRLPVMPLLKEEIPKIKSQRSTQQNQENVLRAFVTDFAGQSVYYDTHGCFVKPHSPYVLVHDLSLEFDEPAVPRFKASNEEKEEMINNPYCTTNLDNFTSWLKFLQSLEEYKDQHFSDKSGDNFKLPPVLIALTHNDKVEGNDSKTDCSAVQRRIEKVLSAGRYENVFPDFFLIDNTLEGDERDEVRKLRRKLFDLANAVLNQEELMPMTWLHFEAALSKKLSPNCKYISIDDAKKEAENCGVVEFGQAIKFLHRLGAVVHHSGSSKVVLDPPWLMNRFTDVISMPSKVDALSRHANEVFKQKGILFQEYLETLNDAELLQELMQKFNLICPGQYEGKPAFYVPSVAPSMMPGEELEDSPIPSLFVTFPRQLVPMSLFTKLQVKLISEWKRRFPNQQITPSFYCNYSLLPFILDRDMYAVRLIHLYEFIMVTVFPKQDGNHFKFASHFLATLKKCLDDLKSPDQLLFSMTSYNLEVKCTCCFGKEEKKCFGLHEMQRHSDRSGHHHFWSLSDLQTYYNDQALAVCQHLYERFDIENVHIWLDTVSEETVVEDSPLSGLRNETSNEASRSEITNFDDEVCERHIPELVRLLGKDVEKVAMLLGVDLFEIEAIKRQEPQPEKQSVKIFNSWRTAEIQLEEKPTWGKICSRLEEETVGRCDVIRALLKEEELDIRVLLWLTPRIAASFRNYARVLGVPDCEIDMYSQNAEGVEKNCMDVLQRWRRRTRYPKVDDLIQALEHDLIQRNELAKEMRKRFCTNKVEGEVKDEDLSQLENLSISASEI